MGEIEMRVNFLSFIFNLKLATVRGERLREREI